MLRTSLLSLLVLCACASSPPSDNAKPARTGEPVRLAYLTYASGQKLGLVNDSHTDRTELYSSTRPLADAGTKVTTDEVIAETVKYFEQQGFFEQAQPGAAPATNEGIYSQSLEVERPGRLVHLSLRKDTPAAQRQMFLECAQAFVQIYNNTYQLQSVDHAPDWQAAQSSKTPKPHPPKQQ